MAPFFASQLLAVIERTPTGMVQQPPILIVGEKHSPGMEFKDSQKDSDAVMNTLCLTTQASEGYLVILRNPLSG